MKGQTKTHSFIEVCINTSIGYFVALITQILVFPLFNIDVTYKQQFLISTIFTVVSILRGYFVRRLFNFIHIKNSPENITNRVNKLSDAWQYIKMEDKK